MSRTYSLACNDCGEEVWIGQGRSKDKSYIYTGDEKVMDNLNNFLIRHMNHNLTYGDDELFDYKWYPDEVE